MTRRTRVFLFVSVGILILGLGTGLVASYMGGFQNLVLIGSDGPEELALVPRDAQMVAYADVHAIANSELRKKIHSNDAAPDSQFEEHTGINVERDIDHVIAASLPQPEPNRGQPPLVLARGNFNTVRIEGAVREQGGTAEDYRGIHVMSMNTPDLQHGAVAFLEPGLLAFGTADAVHRAIDLKLARAGSIKDNGEVMGLVKGVKDGNVWAVARFDALAGRAPLPPNLAGRLPAINWFSASGTVDDGIRGVVRAEARDDQAAQDLREVIRGFMALARMQAGGKAEFSGLINSLQLSGEGKSVTLTFAVPPEMLDTLAAMHARRPAPPAPGAPPAPLDRTTPRRPRAGA